LAFSPDSSGAWQVAERIEGDATTDFGAPGQIALADREPLDAAEASRLAALVQASWALFDAVVAGAPLALRKGARGGGRDRDAMVQHVLSAEQAYARKIGVRHPEPQLGDTAAIGALRRDVCAVLGQPGDGSPVVEGGWPPRYAARRIAWHVLDHAWEIEDRSPE
jgi:hypothetical protein